MTIENSENPIDGNQLPMKKQNVFAPNSTVIAGFIVKHPFFDIDLLLIGFTPQCPGDKENTQVRGLSWKNSVESCSIYPKVIFDMQQNPFKVFHGRFGDESKWNFYLYSLVTDDEPGKWTNNPIYAVCKYREDGIIKHEFFNLHELSTNI